MSMQPTLKLEASPDHFIFNVNEDTKKAIQTLRLTNSDPKLHIFYKIRTTGKVRYVVKPNLGVVPPQSHFDVSIVFTLPVGEDISKPIRDKFVVFSMVGYKTALDKVGIDKHMTENLSLCDKKTVTAVARLANKSNGIKQSLSISGVSPLTPSMAMSAYQARPDDSPRFPGFEKRSGRETEIMESANSKSQNVSDFSNNSNLKFTKMIEKMKSKAGESAISESSKPLAQTLQLKIGENVKPVSLRQNPVNFEAQVSNEVFFEMTNKMIAEDSESSLYIVRPDKSFGHFDSIRSPVRVSDFSVSPKSASFAKPDLILRSNPAAGVFAHWHLILAFIVGTILGAFFNGR